MNALNDLYIATSGSSWTWKPVALYGNIWNFSQPNANPCTDTWQGIVCTSKCSTSQCYVKELILENYNLNGTLPSTLDALNQLLILSITENPDLGGTIPSTLTQINLQQLNLELNALTGSLPSTMGSWTSLQELYVANNENITYSIPPSICDCIELSIFSADSTYFTGTIPNCIGQLINLTALYLVNNLLTGTIPNSITTLPLLYDIAIAENMITGTIPSNIGNLVNLQYLFFYETLLDGRIPDSIGNLIKLVEIDIGGNQLTGALPSSLSNCHNLTELVVANNALTGSIPDIFGNLTKLITLELSTNLFSGTIPGTIVNLTAVRTVLLYNNTLTGSIPYNVNLMKSIGDFQFAWNFVSSTLPDSLFLCEYLYKLDFNDNFLTGSLPNTMGMSTPDFTVLHGVRNLFTGSIPSGIVNLINMQEFELGMNMIDGTIPSEIGRLTELTLFLVYNNSLSGSLPPSFSNLTNLYEIDLFTNSLNGSLPHDIGNLKSLAYLFISDNAFSGSLPSSLVNCTKLLEVNLDRNKLTGTFPKGLESLKLLSYLSLIDNLISGSIPNELYMDKPLLYITYLDYNLFTGTLPLTISNVVLLYQVTFAFNMLTGTIPSNIGNARLLNVLEVQHNEMIGSIPSSLYTLPYLGLFYASGNQLTGRISPSVGNLTDLVEVDLHTNYFTSTLPSSLLTLPTLYFAYLDVNYFIGEIPFNAVIHALNPLTELLLNENMFSGTLSPSIDRFPLLAAINISTNYLTGTLPSSLRSMTHLATIDISNNQFEGSLIGIFDKAIYLVSFFVESNAFTGKLQDVFNYTTQRSLIYIDVSDNRLSGSLSSEFFLAENMSSFAAVKNCLTGSIPDTICGNRFMQSLALDGLHTAESCQKKLVPGFPAYVLDNGITGSIPSCLFQMDRLNTLHLSGNGVQGTIPVSDISFLSPELNDLSLSHNVLTGSIPSIIQEHSWSQLDLSFNRLNGKLLSSMLKPVATNYSYYDLNIDSSVSLKLTVNRLSGGVPHSIVSALGIQILLGNLFGCRFLHRDRDLPRHDQYYDSYQCGSNMIDIPMILWACILGVCMLVIGWVAYYLRYKSDIKHWVHSWWDRRKQWWSVYTIGTKPVTQLQQSLLGNTFAKELVVIRRISWTWTIVIIVVFIPIYCILSAFFSTHEYTYAWFVSLAYMEGIPPAVTMLFVFVLVCMGVEYQIDWLTQRFKNHNVTENVEERDDSEYAPSEREEGSTSTMNNTVSDLTMSSVWFKSSHKLTRTYTQNTEVVIEREVDAVKWILLSIFVVIVNIVLVLSINAAYIYSTTLTLSPFKQGVITVAIIAFKIVWSVLIVARLMGDLFEHTLNVYLTYQQQLERYQQRDRDTATVITSQRVQEMAEQRLRYERRISRFLVVLSLFNTVIAPCLAVMLVSPECFLYVITTPDSVSASYKYFQCDGIYNTLDGYICVGKTINEHSISYSPAFSYSYQCTSSLLGSFIDVYLYRYLVTGLLFPLVFSLVQTLQRRYVVKYFLPEEGRSLTGWKWWCYVALCQLIPVAMRIVDSDSIQPLPSSDPVVVVPNPLSTATLSSDDHATQESSKQTTGDSVKVLLLKSTSKLLPNDAGLVFNARRFTTVLVGDLAIFLTFGTIYPPVAIAIAISIFLNTVHIQTVLGRFLTLTASLLDSTSIGNSQELLECGDKLLEYVQVIMRESSKVGSLFALSMAPITVLATVFWSFFLFDILGSEIGTIKALWILFVLPCVLFIVRGVVLAYRSWIISKQDKKYREKNKKGIELRKSSYRQSSVQ